MIVIITIININSAFFGIFYENLCRKFIISDAIDVL
jgi:hypothetical protein